MNETMDFEQAEKQYRPDDESPEQPASEPKGSSRKEPSLDGIQDKFGIIFTDGKAVFKENIAGIPYQEQTVHIIHNDDGTILPIITRNVLPFQHSMTGHNVPSVIIDDKEYYTITCNEYHPLIVSRNESGETTVMTELIDAQLAQTCIYGHIVCALHSYRFESTKEIVCVKHISHYCRSLLIRAKYNSNKDLMNRFLGLVGLRRPVVRQNRQ